MIFQSSAPGIAFIWLLYCIHDYVFTNTWYFPKRHYPQCIAQHNYLACLNESEVNYKTWCGVEEAYTRYSTSFCSRTTVVSWWRRRTCSRWTRPGSCCSTWRSTPIPQPSRYPHLKENIKTPHWHLWQQRMLGIYQIQQIVSNSVTLTAVTALFTYIGSLSIRSFSL